jgi:PPK2 family polyphosphate:nucleotide phosphotransferase
MLIAHPPRPIHASTTDPSTRFSRSTRAITGAGLFARQCPIEPPPQTAPEEPFVPLSRVMPSRHRAARYRLRMSIESLHVKPGTKVVIRDQDASLTPGVKNKSQGEELLEENKAKLAELQYRLWAENTRSLLVVLQGMDTSGKDGVVRHVMTGMDPAGCRVTSFKKPSEEEIDHDFLWRIHRETPAKGEVGVFNRSHYEDVLVVRVNNLVPEAVWRRRYDQINAFEKLLTDGGTVIVKCFLHISKAEQRERLLARLNDPLKNWKFNAGDIEERKKWDLYIGAYEDALSRCASSHAPFYRIPADKKWYRNWAVSEILVRTLESMNPKVPKGTLKPKDFFIGD